jgi:hypothetical protein
MRKAAELLVRAWHRFNGPGLAGTIGILTAYALVEWMEQWGGPAP